MRKILSSLTGLALAMAPVSAAPSPEPETSAPVPLTEEEMKDMVFIPNIDNVDLAPLKYSHIIPVLALNVTFNQQSDGLAGDTPSTPETQIQQVEFASVFMDRTTGEYDLMNCAALKYLRDSFLVEQVKTSDLLVEKVLKDQTAEFDRAAVALQCPDYRGPSV